MAEKQHRRNFLTTILQALRNTLRKYFNRKFRRNSSLSSTPAMQDRSASMRTRKDSVISSYSLQPPRSIHVLSAPYHRHSLYTPENTDYKHEHEHEENSQEPPRVTKSLRTQRLASRLNRLETFPREQTSMVLNRRSTFASSRLPTPTQPPRDELYSHSVYQKEGRRSVLSPLGRQWAMESRELPKISESRARRPTTHGGITLEHPNRQSIVIRRSSVRYNDGRNHTSKEVKIPTPALALAPIRKERTERDDGGKSNNSGQFLLPCCYQTQSRLSSFEAISAETPRNTMASRKRIRLTQGFEDLKKPQELQPTKLPMRKHNSNFSPAKPTSQVVKTLLQTQTHEQTRENDAPTAYLAALQQPSEFPPLCTGIGTETPKGAKKLVSKLPLVSTSSTRRRVLIEKMVPTPLLPRDPQHTIHIPARVPTRLSNPKRRPVLTSDINLRPQVETAMPQGYWLGRFMTLTNAFHYEDSFDEPDIATGFEMPSSYSRPFQGSDSGDRAGYRAKRAFMVLENLCVSEEASVSLREFRDGYIGRFGDRWMI